MNVDRHNLHRLGVDPRDPTASTEPEARSLSIADSEVVGNTCLCVIMPPNTSLVVCNKYIDYLGGLLWGICLGNERFKEFYLLQCNTTLCADIDSLNENFESIDVTTPHIIPDCWYRLSPKSTIYPSVINGLSQNGVRDKVIKFADKYPQYLILPRFGVPLNTLQLDFRLDRSEAISDIADIYLQI